MPKRIAKSGAVTCKAQRENVAQASSLHTAHFLHKAYASQPSWLHTALSLQSNSALLLNRTVEVHGAHPFSTELLHPVRVSYIKSTSAIPNLVKRTGDVSPPETKRLRIPPHSTIPSPYAEIHYPEMEPRLQPRNVTGMREMKNIECIEAALAELGHPKDWLLDKYVPTRRKGTFNVWTC